MSTRYVCMCVCVSSGNITHKLKIKTLSLSLFPFFYPSLPPSNFLNNCNKQSDLTHSFLPASFLLPVLKLSSLEGSSLFLGLVLTPSTFTLSL